MVEGTARLYGANAKITYTNGYPVVVNHERQTAFAADVAREIAGKEQGRYRLPPVMGAEDFAFMLNERPGAFIFVGNGDSAGLHHPAYDFNDEAIPLGTSYWVRLAETALRAESSAPASRGRMRECYCAASTRFSAGSFGGSATTDLRLRQQMRPTLRLDAAPIGEVS